MEILKNFCVALFTHKRMKAFYWHTGAMLAAVLVDILPQLFIDFNLPNWITIGVGLILAQITKYLNTKNE